tara:strand:- start:1371 stop:2147 length:777 start_codon:yes stop_codon:yes gene_type:complete
MRVLFLSPGDLETQLERLPLAAAIGRDLNASIQVACPLAAVPLWKLLPAVEKPLPFEFEGVTLADWANLLGCVREPDFQACLNFASGWNLDLLLSLSHIPVRVARGGFSCTAAVAADAQASDFLKPLGLANDQPSVCISLPPKALEQARSQQPAGDGPLLLLAPGQAAGDWSEAHWTALEEAVCSRITGGRCQRLRSGSIVQETAQLASADGVVSSSPVASKLAQCCGVSVVELQQLAGGQALQDLPLETVLKALGIG